MKVLEYEIHEVLSTLSENKDGMKKQLTITSWNHYSPKFDIRAWNDEYTKMSKGITLTMEELMQLRDALNDIDIESVMADAIEEQEKNK